MTMIDWKHKRGRPQTPVVPASRVGRVPTRPVPPVPIVEASPYGLSFTYGGLSDSGNKTMRQICEEIAGQHGVTFLDLCSDRCCEVIYRARQEAYYRLRHETMHSLTAIGRFLGGRDHSSVIHGIRRHEERTRRAEAAAAGAAAIRLDNAMGAR